MEDVTLIESDDVEWDTWIEATDHDIYHTAGYHRVPAFAGDGTPQLLIYGTRDRFVAWPYLLQQIATDDPAIGSPAFDINSTYGYGGPLVKGCEVGDPLIGRAWEAFQRVWREQHVVSVFTRFHPILENHRWFVGALQPADDPDAGLGMIPTGETVSIDVTRPDAEALANYPRIMRQEIAQGRRRGLTTAVDTDLEDLDIFVELYQETMARNNAKQSYFVGRDYFESLKREVGDDVILFVTRCDGDIVGACLFLAHHGILHPHLAGTATKYLAMSPLKVMWDDVRIWAAQRGDRVMHLGGGRGGTRDSLFAFKARFSPERHTFYTGRWVLDRPRYDRLAAKALGVDPDAGYFPIYRAQRSLD
jgi:hypothetical protein